MQENISKRVLEAFQLTIDLAEKTNSKNLKSKLPNLKSNKIGEQFWCIIGARESYLKAIQSGEWKGFGCSVENRFSSDEICTKLKESALAFEGLTQEKLSEKQLGFVLDLLTHEVQHHGQLIRYCYALDIMFPKSWNQKYTV